MDRLRAVAYGVGVAITVFTYLALPLLRELYGPVVVLPVYAVVATVAGLVTYSLVRSIRGAERRAREHRRVPGVDEEADAADAGSDDGGSDRPEPDVDREIEQLKDDL